MTDHRRPAGVDPTQLGRASEIARDVFEGEAQAIGRRAAAKLVAKLGAEGLDLPETREAFAEIVEAEVRSAFGTPTPGEVVVRLSYPEAVQVATAVVEASTPDRSASEGEILADLRGKLFSSIGIAVPVD